MIRIEYFAESSNDTALPVSAWDNKPSSCIINPKYVIRLTDITTFSSLSGNNSKQAAMLEMHNGYKYFMNEQQLHNTKLKLGLR